jgi:hypothetical protein
MAIVHSLYHAILSSSTSPTHHFILHIRLPVFPASVQQNTGEKIRSVDSGPVLIPMKKLMKVGVVVETSSHPINGNIERTGRGSRLSAKFSL